MNNDTAAPATGAAETAAKRPVTPQGVTQEKLDNWFTYHSPTPDQLPKYGALRAAAKAFAEAIVANTPSGPDQTVAVRYVREAVMVANQSIACGGQ